MKSYLSLPEGYIEQLSIDLAKDKKLSIIINTAAFLIAAALVVFAPVPIRMFFEANDSLGSFFLRYALLLAGIFAYIILHELVHGIFIKYFSGENPKYGFTRCYAYAGSDAYFDKKSYIIIALAPIVIWGLVLALLCALVPESWFWVVYGIQIINVSGAAGDLYVTWRFSKLPPNILVRDCGVAMTVYTTREEKE